MAEDDPITPDELRAWRKLDGNNFAYADGERARAFGRLLNEVERLRTSLRTEFAAGADYQRQAAEAIARAETAERERDEARVLRDAIAAAKTEPTGDQLVMAEMDAAVARTQRDFAIVRLDEVIAERDRAAAAAFTAGLLMTPTADATVITCTKCGCLTVPGVGCACPVVARAAAAEAEVERLLLENRRSETARHDAEVAMRVSMEGRDYLEAEVERLRAKADGYDKRLADCIVLKRRAEAAEAEVERLRNCFVCVECGPGAVDEDGCCTTCGRDALRIVDGRLVNTGVSDHLAAIETRAEAAEAAEAEAGRLRAERNALRPLTADEVKAALHEGAAESRAAQGDNAWSSLLRQRDEWKSRAETAEAAAAVRGGEWCAENRRAGRGPCGACAHCCQQAESNTTDQIAEFVERRCPEQVPYPNLCKAIADRIRRRDWKKTHG